MKTLFLLACVSGCNTPPQPSIEKLTLDETSTTWSVNFSPKGGCTTEIVKLIASAKVSIRVAAYSFTAKPISAALISQKAAGVDVAAVLDQTNAGTTPELGTQAPVLKAGGVPVWIDSKHVIFHDKYIIVDDKTIETGSFNYTAEAENANAENCFVYHSTTAAKAFADNWVLHQSHSMPY